ncbi:MAG: hypothetical protein ACK5KU_07380 [Beutenbergiaceae bacterium]
MAQYQRANGSYLSSVNQVAVRQASSTRRIRAKLDEAAARSDSLDARIDRLEAAVIALTQLEDARASLTASDAASTRRYARDVLARIPELGRVASTHDPQEPPDVPDYWLHPAARSVQHALAQDVAAQQEAVQLARQRDPLRTGVFLTVVAALWGQSVSDDDLAALWPTTVEMSRFQRQIWQVTANGLLGESARDGLIEALRRAVWGSSDGMLVSAALLGTDQVRNPDTAAEALTRLRERVDGIVEGAQNLVGDGSEPVTLSELLNQVIEAGAPGEDGLVAQIVAIRDALDAVGASSRLTRSATMDEEALDVVAYLISDLTNRDEPGLAAVAVQVYREVVLDHTQTWQAESMAQAPTSRNLKLGWGVSAEVNTDGATNDQWRTQVADNAAQSARPGGREPIVGGLALAVAGVVLTAIFAPGWLAATAAGLGIAAYGWYQNWVCTTEQRALRERAIGDSQTAIAAAVKELNADADKTRSRHQRAQEDAAQIRSRLEGTARGIDPDR